MSNRQRQVVSFAMILGAVAFGMVLAGGLHLTPSTDAQNAGPIVPKASGEHPSGITLPSFADLAEAIEPAVASVQTSTIRERQEGVDPFHFFFGPRDRREGEPEQQPERFRSEGGGSGFVISPDGLVVTNYHVVEEADAVTVRLEGREFAAEVVGSDPPTDLALLKVDVGHELPYLALGDSDALRPGDWVMAIGDPLGLAQTVTVGVVSAKGRQINLSSETSFENFIQTDAAINFGNSGGPLINTDGEVVGINSAINWGAENIGFAVPVNTLKQILPQLRDQGSVSRGYLGIQIQDVDYPIAQAFGLEEPQGVLVSQVLTGEPADAAGMRHGDIVLEVDGRAVANSRFLIDYVSAKGPGEPVELTVYRNGKRIAVTVDLTERPTEAAPDEAEPTDEEAGIEWLGIRYQNLTPGARQSHGIPSSVEGIWIVSVDPTSPLWDEGIRNDGLLYVVTEVNGRQVGSIEGFEAAVREAPPGSRLRLYVRRFHQGEELAPTFVLPRVP